LAISATSYSNETFNNEVIKQWMPITHQTLQHCTTSFVVQTTVTKANITW